MGILVFLDIVVGALLVATIAYCIMLNRKLKALRRGESELRDVQDYLTGSFVFGLERNNNLVSYAVRARRFDLGFDHIHEYPTLIRAVTREDVRRVAREHLDPDRVVIVSAGAG